MEDRLRDSSTRPTRLSEVSNLGTGKKSLKKNLIKPEMIMKLKDRHKDSD